MKEKTKPKAFRAWAENAERLEYAEEVGLNVSEIINELLQKYLKPTIENKVQGLRKKLNAPVP